jgi:hypothetical protein
LAILAQHPIGGASSTSFVAVVIPAGDGARFTSAPVDAMDARDAICAPQFLRRKTGDL